MFLKRIEMQGFKSFADKTIIEFDHGMTGIVGPNGCGKSNISDAIRWVLGEQSAKSLRGDSMTDVIFSGSENRRAVNMAEVTLVFDNSTHALNSDLDEVEVTRRIYNTDQDAEYLINRKSVRLKDVTDLILDTGLGKNSLSMISQGNITSFAEARPYDRRAIFEEAAGVAKYKKRKDESLKSLERTKDNLDRAFDVLQELEKQVAPLKRQAARAKLYREKKDRLEEIEIAVLVNGITQLNEEKKTIEKSIFDAETDFSLQQTSIGVSEGQISELKSQQRQLDNEINSMQDKLVNIIQDIQRLENRKVEIEEKRKYALEKGNAQEKAKEIMKSLQEAKLEYEDRENRFQQIKSEVEILSQQKDETLTRLMDANIAKDQAGGQYQRMLNRANVLEDLLKDPFSSKAQMGVKTIMDNRSFMTGILGVVGQEIHPIEGYEEALTAALAGSIYHIVTKDESSARKAIGFLRNNRSGRATFLPLTVCKRRYVGNDHLTIARNSDGFLGTCDEFAENEPLFDEVRDSLLGNVLLCDTLEHANELAHLLKYQYNIVSLEGDIVHRGGTMTGGRVKNSTSILSAQSELNKLKQDLISAEAAYQLAQKDVQNLQAIREKLESDITGKKIMQAQLETVRDTKLAKYDKLKNDYEASMPQNNSEEEMSGDSVIVELNNAYQRKDETSTALKLKREERIRLNGEIDRNDQQIRLMRKKVDGISGELRSLSSKQASVKTKLDENLSRLSSEYQMTYEYALENTDTQISETSAEEVITLRNEIKNLGNINMSAPEEYEEVNQRYEALKANYDDLTASRDKILKAIQEMDETMKKQFKETFDQINAALPETFKAIFGGGKAKLSLEDENDLLNSGIDIDVQPPGKSVQSIRLFSGGEKTLIAICVLFTILKIRQIPLILFDEVEAALDEGNVARIAKYIKEYSKENQFILITHRPGTMEECDVLYGVTMQNRGVSQMMKVRLIDAMQMADKEENNGLS